MAAGRGCAAMPTTFANAEHTTGSGPHEQAAFPEAASQRRDVSSHLGAACGTA